MPRPHALVLQAVRSFLGGLAELRACGWASVLLTTGPISFMFDADAHPWRDLLAAGVSMAGLAIVVRACLRPRSDAARPRRSDALLCTMLVLYAACCLILVGKSFGVGARVYSVDAALYNHVNAALVLEGRNPYTADDAWYAATRLDPKAAPTSLQRGRYADRTRVPAAEEVRALAARKLRTGEPAGPEFDETTLHSYPALSFLVHVPGLWLGLPTTVVTSLLLFLALVGAVLRAIPRRLWAAAILVILGNGLAVASSVQGVFEAWALLPVLLAFQLRRHRRLSPFLLGLACAIKQIVWPIALLSLVIAWREGGKRAALRHGAIAAGAFLLPNLPFILLSPSAWVSSMLVPMSLPMFPDGLGVIALSTSGLLPFAPKPVYALGEVLALAGLAWWFARRRPMPDPYLALVLGTLPFLLAWRSALSYVWLVPMLALCLTPRLASVRRLPAARAGDEPAAAAA